MTALALGVIADDLTGGAAIAGEVARERNAAVDVVTLPVFDAASTPAVVVETASRYVAAASSTARVLEAYERLRDCGCATVMKKIDSTLKGNVATELAAFVQSAAGPVVIAPACPAVRLGLRGGVQTRDGIAGRDVTGMIERALGYPAARLDIDVVREGPAKVAAALSEIDENGVVLADAVDDADLAAVAEGAYSAGVRSFAGTYGLGAALANAMKLDEHAVEPAEHGSGLSTDRILFIAGSANPVSARQIHQLVADGAHEIVLDVPRLLVEPVTENARILAELTSAPAPVTVIHSAANETREEVIKIRDVNGWTERELAEWIATPFVNAIREVPDAGIYFLGGETTGAICDRLGWTHFTVTGEIAPAVPLARIKDNTVPFVLTKPGAFGEPGDLVAAAHRQLRLPHSAT